MTTYAAPATSRVPIHLAALAAAVTGLVGAVAGAAIAGDDAPAVPVVENVVADPSPAGTPTWVEVLERARVRQAVDHMPAGWPATEAMRQELDAPLGDAAQRARWEAVADRMPAGWPATDVMRKGAEEPSG